MSTVPELGPGASPSRTPPRRAAARGADRSARRLVVGGVLVALIVLMALVSYVWTP